MNRTSMAAALLVSALAAAAANAAQAEPSAERNPAKRRLVIQLAHVLGEAHALHRLCAGPDDATWYDRMRQLIAEESPDIGFRQQLVQSFNGGFSEKQEAFAECGPASKAAERKAAAEGRALAAKLSGGPPALRR